jgi:hypothetical protein
VAGHRLDQDAAPSRVRLGNLIGASPLDIG